MVDRTATEHHLQQLDCQHKSRIFYTRLGWSKQNKYMMLHVLHLLLRDSALTAHHKRRGKKIWTDAMEGEGELEIGFSIKQTKGCTRAAACSQLTVSTNCWAGPAAAAGSSSGTAPPSCCTPPCRPVAAAKRFVRVSSHPRHRLRVPAPC